MAKTKPHAERAELLERYRALLVHMERRMSMNASAVARKLDVHSSTIAAAKTRGPSAELRTLLEERLGVARRYWTAEPRPDPAECIVLVTESPAAKSRTADAREEALAIAEEDGIPDEAFREVGRLKPPPGRENDGFWWWRAYRAIVAAYPRGRKAG